MKRNWIQLIGVAVVFLTAQNLAHAEHWTSLGKHPLGEMFYNSDAVGLRDSMINFWARRLYSQPQDSKISKIKFTEQRVYQELDCQKHTMRIIGMVFYDAKGKPTGAYKDLKLGAQPIQSSGFFEKEANLLCPLVAGTQAALVKKAGEKPQTAKPSLSAVKKPVQPSPKKP